MCGFSGFFTLENLDYQGTLKKITECIHHRGPDDTKYLIDKKNNFYAGFKRLSIIDLSNNGSQPMQSFDKRFTILFNGEIYNFKEIKKKLIENNSYENKIIFKGTSDTEVLINCISFFGIDKTLSLVEGQYAIALWDDFKKNFYLIRDRFGEKPLYYGTVNNTFIFSSELKAISIFPNFNQSISKKSLEYYLRFLSVPEPKTIYENIFKVQSSEIVTLNFQNNRFSLNDTSIVTKKQYWSPKNIAIQAKNNLFDDYEISQNQIEKSLRESIKLQSYADVPIGSFLSGGIDSTLICALQQTQSNNKINTFSIGFDNKSFNEASYAKKISKYLNTNHNEIILNESKNLDIVSNLSNIYCEPFADSSQLPTFLLCNELKKFYKVALSGDGGDELFGGYNRYIWISKIWPIINLFPITIRKLIFKYTSLISLDLIDSIFFILKKITFNYINVKFAGQKLNNLSIKLQTVNNIDELFMYFISEWTPEDKLILNHEYDNTIFYKYSKNNQFSIEENMMMHDTINYLPNDILTKTDRASMNNSVEIRSPFLNSNLFKNAWQVPQINKIYNNNGKIILKDILKKYIPKNLYDRPKQGFAVPIDDWLRTSLYDWANDYLSVESLKSNNFFDFKIINRRWEQHLSGKKNWGQSLWTVIIFQQWYQNR